MNKEHKENVCPICGSNNIEYGSMELGVFGDELYYPAECKDCKATFEEYYKLTFDGHENIKTNEE